MKLQSLYELPEADHSHRCLFFINRKTPEALRLRGILRLNTMYRAVHIISLITIQRPQVDSAYATSRCGFSPYGFSKMYSLMQAWLTHLLQIRMALNCYTYSMMVVTVPAPTVRPPSRIAKRRPCSIATLWISSTVISTLSPGMHISTPSGSSQTPVTSVVLK